MSIWSRIFGGNGYEDEKMVDVIQRALSEDPLISDPGALRISSADGVITLSGKVDRSVAKDHVEGAARDALRYGSYKFVRIVNDITVKRELAA